MFFNLSTYIDTLASEDCVYSEGAKIILSKSTIHLYMTFLFVFEKYTKYESDQFEILAFFFSIIY